MRILMIEDDERLCDAVQMQLARQGYTVTLSHNGTEGLLYLQQGAYDLAIVDRMLPGMDGLQIIRNARQGGNTTPVLLLTAMAQIGDRVDGLDAGADDYLGKPFDMRELLARVRALVRRPAPFQAKAELQFGDILLDVNALTLQGSLGRCTLSKKEGELLAVLMKSQGETLTRYTLFARVWGIDTEVEEASLDSYAHFIRRRLKTVSKSVVLVTVRGVGYRLEAIA